MKMLWVRGSFSSRANLAARNWIGSSFCRVFRQNQSLSTKSSANRLKGLRESVFSQFTHLAIKHNAYNLGQGFPSFSPPKFVLENGKQAIASGQNQYTRHIGHPLLCRELSHTYSALLERDLIPDQEVLVTCGATQALFTIFQAFLNPSDEVILMEPFYDAYEAQVVMAGGVPKYVPLMLDSAPGGCLSTDWPTSDEFQVDFSLLEQKITPKTKMLVVNNPHNPTGKVWKRSELEKIAQIALKHNLYVISDEVYEFLVYSDSPQPHTRIATLPGMWDRTFTVGSAGKTFSVTGWKIGWVFCSAENHQTLAMAHQWIPFCVSSPLQEAIAKCFSDSRTNDYFSKFRESFENKRNLLASGLLQAGFHPILPHGGYFIITDFSSLLSSKSISDSLQTQSAAATLKEGPPSSIFSRPDFQMACMLAEKARVVGIPPSAFYSDAHYHLSAKYLRFAFCKEDVDLMEACRSLEMFHAREASDRLKP
eukprot:Sdes_comp20732_c0_seq1m16540